MNKLSFCITSYYKDIHYLQSLLDKLINQKCAPHEIIIYCSGVRGIDIPSSIVINNITVPMRTIIDQSPQLQTVARNICADAAHGNIVTFFDIDDIPHPQKIEATLKYIGDYDFLVHSYKKDKNEFDTIDVDNIKYNDKVRANPNPITTNLQVLPERPIHHGHLTVKKSLFSNIRYDENFYFTNSLGQKFCNGEDGKFCQDLVNSNYKGIFLDEPLIIYT